MELGVEDQGGEDFSQQSQKGGWQLVACVSTGVRRGGAEGLSVLEAALRAAMAKLCGA